MVCAKAMPAVSGLEGEFPGQVNAIIADAMTPAGKEAVKALGFKNHGLVIRSPAGEALWQQPDHEVNIEDVREALRGILGS